jgi:hypothetical protein
VFGRHGQASSVGTPTTSAASYQLPALFCFVHPGLFCFATPDYFVLLTLGYFVLPAPTLAPQLPNEKNNRNYYE